MREGNKSGGRDGGAAGETEPCERVEALKDGERARRDGRTAYAVEAVASGNEIAAQFIRRAVFAEPDLRRRAVEIVDSHVLGLEDNLTTGGEARGDQILDD